MVIPIRRPPVNPGPPFTSGNRHPFSPTIQGAPMPSTKQSGFLQQLLSGVSKNSSGGVSADGIMSTLNHVQRILGVVQSGAPIIQQYGPLVRNLPAIYKMMKALNETDPESQEPANFHIEDESRLEEPDSSAETDLSYDPNNSDPTPVNVSRESTQGQSVPKLFI